MVQMLDTLLPEPSPEAWCFVLAIFGIGALVSLLAMILGHAPTARVVTLVAGVLGGTLQAAISARTLWSGAKVSWVMPTGIPFADLSLRLDPLSSLFTLALGLVVIATSIYAHGYTASMTNGRAAGALGFFVNLLLLGLSVVFTASNVLVFLVAWEVMALAAYALVSFEHRSEETREAGILFFIMSHVGTGFLIVGFLLLSVWSGSFEFKDFHLQAGMVRYGILFFCFLVGFGVKAGIIPLHIWLPAAHPVCPSHVSALMSGIVVKTGIYGLIRVCFEFLGLPPVWAALLILLAGISSGLIGVLYALIEKDLKRLLAYSTIENVGIILIGLGASMLFSSLGRPALAAIAMIGALAHIFNHAMFKSLLFLGAGSVLHGAHSRNMELMGGLIRRMPITAALFLAGSIAISGLPPLNGFLSEWVIYQSLLSGFGATPAITRLLFPVAGSLLALTGALAAATFVKAFGITFLALPRSASAEEAHESHWSMLLGMGILAGGCVAVGLFGSAALTAIDPVSQQLLGQRPAAGLTVMNGFGLSSGVVHGGTVSNLGISAVLAALIGLAVLAGLALGVRAKRRVGVTWDCGLPGLTEDNEYTATAFSKPIRMVFAALFQPSREIVAQFDISPYFPKSVAFETEVEQRFEDRLYRPFKDRLLEIAMWLRRIQAGSLHAYLAYIFITLVILLLFGVRP
jgi:hydrogenase-4 component B